MGMMIDDCIKMLIAKEKCMKRETSGIDTDCNSHNCDNCSLCYEQGTMGEQKMALLFAVDAMRQYQLMQADYENRLKAYMVAMLTELHIRMEEIGDDLDPTEDWDYGYKSGVEDMIQLLDERIDKLKGESDAQEQKKE